MEEEKPCVGNEEQCVLDSGLAMYMNGKREIKSSHSALLGSSVSRGDDKEDNIDDIENEVNYMGTDKKDMHQYLAESLISCRVYASGSFELLKRWWYGHVASSPYNASSSFDDQWADGTAMNVINWVL